MQTFSLGEILSVTTGKKLSEDCGKAVFDHLTGGDTTAVSRETLRDQVREVILTQHPALKDIVVPTLHNQKEVEAWLNSIATSPAQLTLVVPA